MIKLKLKFNDSDKKNIDNFPKKFKQALEPAFEKIMVKVEAKSKKDYFKSGSKTSPIDSSIVTSRSGNLRRLISSEVKRQGDKIYAIISADIEYAATHEDGDPSRNIKPRPFLTPAIEDVIDDRGFEDIIMNEINKRTIW